MRNTKERDNSLLREGVRALRHRLPVGWSVSEPVLEPSSRQVDATAEIIAPDGRRTSMSFEVKTRLDPKGARSLVEIAREAHVDRAFIVIARYLGEATRARLREADVGYLDLTGNVRIVVSEPGMFIETHGAERDPERTERPARSLRGAKAGRIARALIDRKDPPGVRDLAVLTNIDAGYVSRVLTFLDAEALIDRGGRGKINHVDWPALLRRWAREAPLESRGTVRTYLDPRGLSAMLGRLQDHHDEQYAVTGALAASAFAFAPNAPARLGMVWIRDAAEVAPRLGLRAADAGANVFLIEPRDEGVFEGAAVRNRVWYAAPSQVAADLLTSPGRGPAEGEQLIEWMATNEDAWRR